MRARVLLSVSEGEVPLETIEGGTGFNAGALLCKESEAIFGSTPSLNDLGSKLMLPFFVTSGAAEFISSLNPKLADELIRMPHKSEHLLMLL